MNSDTHSYTAWDKTHTQTDTSNTLPLSVRTSATSPQLSHTDVPLGTPAGYGGFFSGGLSGIWEGATEGLTGPQSLDESFLCGTQSIVCAGKGHGDGNTAQSWTLNSDSSFSMCECLCEAWRPQQSLSVGERNRKCVQTHPEWTCVSQRQSKKVKEHLKLWHKRGLLFFSLKPHFSWPVLASKRRLVMFKPQTFSVLHGEIQRLLWGLGKNIVTAYVWKSSTS